MAQADGVPRKNKIINTCAPAYGPRKQVIGDLMAKFCWLSSLGLLCPRYVDASLLSPGLLVQYFITIWLQELFTPALLILSCKKSVAGMVDAGYTA